MKKTLSLILCFIAIISNAQINLTQGLIGHYPLNGNANDISGNNINGIVTNATLTTDRNGNANSAYYFNGSSAYIGLPFSNLYNFAPQDSFSISVWVLPDPGNSWPAQAVVVKSPSHPDYTLSLWNYGSYILNYKAMSGYAYNNIVNGTTSLTPNDCWYNLITTYKNGVWKLYINGVLESSDNSQTRFILQDGSSKIFFGKKGESFGDYFKGKMDEVRLYNRVLNVQEVDSIVGTCFASCPQKNDFSFSRNPCAPLDVSFATNATGFDDISWDFGDGNTALGLTVAPHTYSTTGNYLVTMITTYPTCADTVKKTITVDVQADNQLIATIDTTICYGTTKQLIATQGLNFCWYPVTGLDNPASATPVCSVTQNTTYYFNSYTTGVNLITNGNFNAGNSGFTSGYTYNPTSGFNPGVYTVTSNLQSWHPSMPACGDHSTGSGNMMVVNGAEIPNIKVWAQTVTVQPNTNYAFSTWLQHVTSSNPAILQFSINDVTIGPVFTANNTACIWDQFYTIWNSGNNTSAVIAIVNQNQVYTGNDFALDDISFAPIVFRQDSVKITVDTALITTSANSIICEGNNVQLTSSGGTSYSWTPATGLSNPNTGNPVASPIVTTQYIVTGTNANNCSANDTVVISVNPKPVVTITADTTICQNASLQLLATGGVSYSWTPANSLDNAAIANPVATPTSLTKYIVTVTNSDNCTAIDSVQVGIRSLTNFTINPPTDLCLKESIQLSAGGGDTYAWSPAGSLDNASIANPAASPLQTTTYSVLITDTVCTNSTTLSTTITVLPLPNVKAFKSNDIDCSSNQSQLSATGAVQYSWTPSVSLNNGNLSNPVASPAITTQYIVTGTDAAGCHNNDSILVLVNATNKGGYLMPTAFTPNNDGMNDCFGIKYWGTILELEFSVYNRWGERVFFTRNPGDCWDGRYKGIAQDPAVFVYTIKAKTSCEENVFRKGTFTLIR